MNGIIAGMMGMLGLPRVITSTIGTSRRIQFRFPRCKSKRIKNKWAKRGTNFKIVYYSFKFRDPITGCQVLVVHPAVEQKLKELMQKQAVVNPKPRISVKKDKECGWKMRHDFGVHPMSMGGVLRINNVV